MELIYFHNGIRIKAEISAKLWVTVFGIKIVKSTYTAEAEYKGEILAKENSLYRINLISGQEKIGETMPTNWYQSYSGISNNVGDFETLYEVS